MIRKKPAALLVSVVALGAALGAATARSSTDAPAAVEPDSSHPVVRVAPVVAAPAARSVTFSAPTRPAERAAVGFTMPGRLVSRSAGVGDVVAAGDRLATLDPEPILNQLRAAEAALVDLDAQRGQVERERARAERLVDAEVASAQVVERLEADARRLDAGLAAARAQRDEARRMLRDTTLVAPVAGVVAQVFAQPGEVVAAGVPVVLLLGQSTVEVEVEVPERVFRHVSEGDAVRVDLPLSGRRGLPGRVTAVGRATIGPGRLFPVVVALDDSEVAAGMAADVTIDVPVPGGVAVPIAALIDPTGAGPAVYRVAGGVVGLVDVALHALEGDVAVVTGDLAAGDEVAVAGQVAVVPGDRVEVRR